jgi:hypothetical protein
VQFIPRTTNSVVADAIFNYGWLPRKNQSQQSRVRDQAVFALTAKAATTC